MRILFTIIFMWILENVEKLSNKEFEDDNMVSEHETENVHEIDFQNENGDANEIFRPGNNYDDPNNTSDNDDGISYFIQY